MKITFENNFNAVGILFNHIKVKSGFKGEQFEIYSLCAGEYSKEELVEEFSYYLKSFPKAEGVLKVGFLNSNMDFCLEEEKINSENSFEELVAEMVARYYEKNYKLSCTGLLVSFIPKVNGEVCLNSRTEVMFTIYS